MKLSNTLRFGENAAFRYDRTNGEPTDLDAQLKKLPKSAQEVVNRIPREIGELAAEVGDGYIQLWTTTDHPNLDGSPSTFGTNVLARNTSQPGAMYFKRIEYTGKPGSEIQEQLDSIKEDVPKLWNPDALE